MSDFGLTDSELAFLGAHVTPRDNVFQWGCRETAQYFAEHCRRVTAVEHQPGYAERAISSLRRFSNVSIVYAPSDLPYVEGTADDGDLSTFRSYVHTYTGLGVNVVFLGGRARAACARWIAEGAPFGPDPTLRVFLLDCERPGYESIFTDTTTPDGLLVPRCFDEVERVERLMLLKMKEG